MSTFAIALLQNDAAEIDHEPLDGDSPLPKQAPGRLWRSPLNIFELWVFSFNDVLENLPIFNQNEASR